VVFQIEKFNLFKLSALCLSYFLIGKINVEFQIGGMDVEVCRNYYGSQTQSFEASLEVEENELLSTGAHRMIFIRAPGIKRMDVSKVKILAKYNDAPVALRQENLLATSFHPELTPDLTWHFYFLNMILQHKAHYKK